MPLSQRLYRRLGILLFSGALVLLFMISAASVWLDRQNRLFSDDVSHTEEVLNRIARLHTEIRTAESSQRGFLLIRDSAYLVAYDLTRLEIEPSIDKLKQLVADDPVESARVEQIKGVATEKMVELARTVADAKAGNFDEAVNRVRTGQGLRLMHDLDALFNAMTAAENQMRTDRARTYGVASNLGKWLDLVGTAATACLGAGFALMTNRYLKTLRKTQEELSQANSGLEKRVQERTAALSKANEEVQRFAYIVSHDLRSPLVNIMGFTSELETARNLVKSKLDAAGEGDAIAVDESLRQTVYEDLPEAIGFIRTSAQKMDRLIKAILQISREGARRLTPESVDLGSLVDGIVSSLQTMLQARNAEIVVERLPTIVTDRLTAEQILSNLLENAVKYLAPQRPGRIVVSARLIGGLIELDVADNGRGIEPRDMERVFELFRRAGTQDQPGEGIGLATVRAQATRLGGTVTCASEPGVGSTFTLTVPRVLQLISHKEAA